MHSPVSRTFIFPYVFEGKCEAGILALDYANLAKGSLPYHAEQSEVIEVDWLCMKVISCLKVNEA